MENYPKKEIKSNLSDRLSPGIEVLENGDILIKLTARGWGVARWKESIGNSITIGEQANLFLTDDPYTPGQEVEILLIPNQTSQKERPTYNAGRYEMNVSASPQDSTLNDEAVFMLAEALTVNDFRLLDIGLIYVYTSYKSPHEKDDEEYESDDSSVIFVLALNDEGGGIGIYGYVDGDDADLMQEVDRVAVLRLGNSK